MTKHSLCRLKPLGKEVRVEAGDSSQDTQSHP